jgi:hypothetical protein
VVPAVELLHKEDILHHNQWLWHTHNQRLILMDNMYLLINIMVNHRVMVITALKLAMKPMQNMLIPMHMLTRMLWLQIPMLIRMLLQLLTGRTVKRHMMLTPDMEMATLNTEMVLLSISNIHNHLKLLREATNSQQANLTEERCRGA